MLIDSELRNMAFEYMGTDKVSGWLSFARAVAEAAVKDAEQALCAVGGGEIAKHENAKGFNQGVVYSAAIIAADCATFASELLSSAGITRVKAREFKCDDHDISCIDEHSAWPKNKGS